MTKKIKDKGRILSSLLIYSTFYSYLHFYVCKKVYISLRLSVTLSIFSGKYYFW